MLVSLYQYNDVLCLVLMFMGRERVKRKKEGLKLDKNGEKYVQK